MRPKLKKAVILVRIFATSDIHGNRNIMNKLKVIAEKVDLILVCGDIGGKNTINKTLLQFSTYQRQDTDYLSGILQDIAIPTRFILGNDDWFEYTGSHYLTQPEDIGGLSLVPFEYVLITPFNTNREVNENKLNYELHKLSAGKNSIIVAHTPPIGAGDILYNGSRCGSRAVRNWIEEVQPKIWLCGHIHENNSISHISDTLVFNCACWYQDDILKGWLIDTDTLDFEEISL